MVSVFLLKLQASLVFPYPSPSPCPCTQTKHTTNCKWKVLLHSLFSKPLPPPGIFDGVKIAYSTTKLKLLFGLTVLFKGQRGTHSIGVGAEGIATIVSNPKFPKNEFFIPGRSFPVCLRHSTIQSVDDVLIDFCGGSLRFAGSDDAESPCDLIMGTGPTTPLWSASAIFDAIRATVSGDWKTYQLLGPDQWVIISHIVG